MDINILYNLAKEEIKNNPDAYGFWNISYTEYENIMKNIELRDNIFIFFRKKGLRIWHMDLPGKTNLIWFEKIN